MQIEVQFVGYRLPGKKRDVSFYLPPFSDESETFEGLISRARKMIRDDPILSKGLSPSSEGDILDKYQVVRGRKGKSYYPVLYSWSSFAPPSGSWKIYVEPVIDDSDSEDDNPGQEKDSFAVPPLIPSQVQPPPQPTVTAPTPPREPQPTPPSTVVVPPFVDIAQGAVISKKYGIGNVEIKNSLQKILQAKLGPRAIPQYHELPVKSFTGDFFVRVEMPGIVPPVKGYGRAPVKKEAEKMAAFNAYDKYCELFPEEPKVEEFTQNPTTILNELFHRDFGRAPDFGHSVGRSGGFITSVEYDGQIFSVEAPNKSKANQLASQKVLDYIKEKKKGSSFTTLDLRKKGTPN